MLNAEFFVDLFGNSYRLSCERFLAELSTNIVHYKKSEDTFIKDFFDRCYKSPFFVAMENPSFFVMADERSRCIMRATQDFLYGLKELACQDCACETTHDEKKAEILHDMVQNYAHRILSFYNIEKFYEQVSQEFSEKYDALFESYAQKTQSVDDVSAALGACKGMIDDILLMQGLIFIRYVDCLKN